jgi:exoribonuclease R
MDIFISNNEIIEIKYSNCMIKVHKNYSYEEPDLLSNANYIYLLDVSKKLSKKYKYINNVRNSHELVCYLMIFMNYYCAKEMIQHKNGIFRSTIVKKEVSVPDNIPEDVGKFIKIWNSACGQYMDGSELNGTQNVRHELLELDSYIHITSPIRRLVDLLNIIKFQQNTGMIQLSVKSEEFYSKWLNDLEYINVTMRSIRKVQTDCSLLDLCANNPNIMEKEYSGYLFDKIIRNDGLFQFMVFLPDLKLSSRITLRENINNFEDRKFKLFLFNDEENFKKKIRLHLIGS